MNDDNRVIPEGWNELTVQQRLEWLKKEMEKTLEKYVNENNNKIHESKRGLAKYIKAPNNIIIE